MFAIYNRPHHCSATVHMEEVEGIKSNGAPVARALCCAERFKTRHAFAVERDNLPVNDGFFDWEHPHRLNYLRIVKTIAVARKQPHPIAVLHSDTTVAIALGFKPP